MLRYITLLLDCSGFFDMDFLAKLPKIPFLSPENKPAENFFALNIGFDKVSASVWTLSNNRLQVLNTAKAPYENGDDFKSEKSLNSLVDGANFALDQALADIMPEPVKLLFGVPDLWLDDENLKAEYLRILKKLVTELGVEPMAYVSTTHAIAHLLQKQQGVPLSAVLVEVGDPIVVTVIKGGKTIASQVKTSGANIGNDIEQVLGALPEIEVFPSKILIYGQENPPAGGLGKIKDELSSHPWMEQLPFLHLPKVEVLPELVETEAVVFAGAFELNPQVFPEIDILAAAATSQLSHRLPAQGHQTLRSGGRAGFVEGDINQSHQRIRESEDSDYSDSSDHSDFSEEWVDPEEKRVPVHYSRQRDLENDSFVSKLQMILMAPLAQNLLKNRKVIIPILVLVLLILLFLFVPKASVSIFVDMKPLENSAQIIADPSITQVDADNNRIPGKIVETDISGSADGDATGKKQIGDPARGKVIVYNATSQAVSLGKGAVLITDAGKKFILDSGVEVASKSASAADPPTRSDSVDSTASEIGPEGNIAAGTDLKVGNYGKAEVVAKVDTAFSGGVSKDVQVVTAEDQQRLLVQVTNQLKQQASQKLQTDLTGDMKVLPESFSEKINKKSYSKNVGDQSAKFNLAVSAHYKGTAYSDADLKSLVGKLVQTKVPDPDHYTLDLSQTETQAEVAKVEPSGKLFFNAQFKAKLMPKFDLNNLKGKIAGKSVDQAQQILRDAQSQIIGANIKLSPSLPGPFQRLPIRRENINIEVTAK